MSERIKVGIIGCGNVTLGYHMPALLALDDVVIVGVADPNELRRKRVQELGKLPDAACCADHRQLLEAKPDYIVLAVPPKFRLAILQDCARSGVHVLTEKPLSTIPLEARTMIELMHQAKLVFGMMHNYLYFPEYQLARELATNGSIGQLRHVTLNFLGMPDNPGAAEYRPQWRHDVAEAGGGILMDMLHVVYVAEMLMGTPVRAVSAVVDNLDHPEDGVEDFCLVHLYFDSGYVTVNLGWGNGMGGLEMSGTEGRVVVLYEQFGTGPFLPLDSFTMKNRDGVKTFALDRDDYRVSSFRRLHAQFAEAVRRGQPAIAPAEAGMRALETVLAAYKSAALGMVVSLPLAPGDPVYRRGVMGLGGLELASNSPPVRRGLFGLSRASHAMSPPDSVSS